MLFVFPFCAGAILGMLFQWWSHRDLRRAVFRVALRGNQLEADNESLKRENTALRREIAQRFAPYVRVERGH